MGTAAAAVMGIVGAGVSTGVSIKQMRDAQAMQEKADQAISDFEYQDLNSLRISTATEELMKDSMASDYATAMGTAQDAGSRAAASITPKVDAAFAEKQRKIYAGLDSKQKELEIKKATMQERRDNAELMGYGGLLNAGINAKGQGAANLASSINNMGAQTELLAESDFKWSDITDIFKR